MNRENPPPLPKTQRPKHPPPQFLAKRKMAQFTPFPNTKQGKIQESSKLIEPLALLIKEYAQTTVTILGTILFAMYDGVRYNMDREKKTSFVRHEENKLTIFKYVQFNSFKDMDKIYTDDTKKDKTIKERFGPLDKINIRNSELPHFEEKWIDKGGYANIYELQELIGEIDLNDIISFDPNAYPLLLIGYVFDLNEIDGILEFSNMGTSIPISANDIFHYKNLPEETHVDLSKDPNWHGIEFVFIKNDQGDVSMYTR